MFLLSLWIAGLTRSGKTTRLISEFRQWLQKKRRIPKLASASRQSFHASTAAALVLAANDDNRRELADKLSVAVQGSYPVICKTPLGFISEEVMLFLPLLFEQLHLKPQFPLRLRPETEQELATRLWRSQLDETYLQQLGLNEYRFVRRTLDLLQLAGASGIPAEDIATILEQGMSAENGLAITRETAQQMGKLLLMWRQWCLERGLLSYGLIYELYWRYLLENPVYQRHLLRRYQAVFADDVDDYPAIAKDLFDFLLNQGAFCVFTYNPDGQIRLGLNADPDYLAQLRDRFQIEELSPKNELAAQLSDTFIEFVTQPFYFPSLPDVVQSLQTTSRAELLRQTGETIIAAVKRKEIKPEEIAIIAPGLDEIARYSLMEILSSQGIPLEPLNEQRPLISSPVVRALLTLLALVYPGLGRLVRKDEVAEMLVVLSRQPRQVDEGKVSKLTPDIDPVRAGLIADYCYHIDLESPCLLPVETFARWDRLGYRATNAYKAIADWLETAKTLQQQQRLTTPMLLLDLAIKQLLNNGRFFPFDQLAALRELMETAEHFWQVDRRLRQNDPISQSASETVAQFIQLLRRGTISANPRPLSYLGKKQGAVTLSTIFQYRSLRSCHRWQFWLDASSPLWEKGGAATLFAAPLFLREWSGRALTSEDEIEANQARLQRILRDLLGRTGERVFLCHSDLSVKGTEQLGPLLSLVHASRDRE